ncbi:MAG: sensor domain-containing diguanylate cyclase [Deltaproteobacteria bacterium]|nr:sensor domain-containing diguanylate cyclase [Deltaproteobacteria bacterium]MBW1961727.1 sensor domain-containing diguanylate cyclase [Deltaproteobacteria bacterium]MBW1995050.1 sensor domain-containing diguanylate cyclase [Deltaproteobacteria bacterium]MBW2151121.1 sensor domain-containing diguanylate cyclase [Deltaproteobacteria bacterium]
MQDTLLNFYHISDIDKIIERLRYNEEITRKFHEIETQLLTITNFRDLFEVLLTQIIEKFKVPYVWLSMIENSEVSSLVQSLESSDILKARLNIIDKDRFLELVGTSMKPLLINDDIKRYHRLFPKRQQYLIKSMAVAPISLHGQIIGSLNQADYSRKRFEPGIDTSRLEQLAVKVSLCLSNVFAHEKLRFLAYHDPLTGLLNRRVMETVLRRELNRSSRYENVLSVVFLDLDDFKSVNDTYGHDTGDDLLKFVANKLIEMSRNSDAVARFAGDEFVFILPETPSKSAKKLMKRIKKHLEEYPFRTGKISIPISISFGVASTEDVERKESRLLLKKADQRLYEEKQRKNNR